MPYHKINISKLSHNQILRLLWGKRVRVKHGTGHEISASEEQHKKKMWAHKYGSGHTIQFDLYQIDLHHHLNTKKKHGKALIPAGYHGGGESIHKKKAKGEGISDIAKAGAKAIAPILIDAASNH